VKFSLDQLLVRARSKPSSIIFKIEIGTTTKFYFLKNRIQNWIPDLFMCGIVPGLQICFPNCYPKQMLRNLLETPRAFHKSLCLLRSGFGLPCASLGTLKLWVEIILIILLGNQMRTRFGQLFDFSRVFENFKNQRTSSLGFFEFFWNRETSGFFF